jgi:DNA-binding transcriptional ArsR family regulator
MLYVYNMSTSKKDDLVYKALADHRRREILDLLKDSPQTTGEICEKFKKLDRCTVMQHLGVLEKAGLVITKREGRFRWNYLNVLPIKSIYDRWINQFATSSVDVLDQMKRGIESGK